MSLLENGRKRGKTYESIRHHNKLLMSRLCRHRTLCREYIEAVKMLDIKPVQSAALVKHLAKLEKRILQYFDGREGTDKIPGQKGRSKKIVETPVETKSERQKRQHFSRTIRVMLKNDQP